MSAGRSKRIARTTRSAAALTGLAAAALGCSSPSPHVDADQSKQMVLEGVEQLTEIAQLTGPGAINDTEAVAVAGTDLGSMANMGDRTFFFFGDTFGDRDPDAVGGQGGIWRSNVAAYTSDSDPSDGITFDGWAPLDEVGWAAPLIEGDHDANTGGGEVTKIPTAGFVVGDALYVQYMSVSHWGEPGAWDANFAALAKSVDRGNTWSPVEGLRWPGDSNFVQLAVAQVQDAGTEYLYMWGIPSGRFGGVQLMRVHATIDAVEHLSAYSYFAGIDAHGAPRWSDQLADAETIIEPTIGELSVMWSEYLDRWIMTYSDGGNAYVREGVTPWGPWGEPIEMVSAAEYPGLYSPYLNPRYVTEDGRRIYFTLSLWGPYNVFWFSVDLVKAQQ